MRSGGGWLAAAGLCLLGFAGLALAATRSVGLAAVDLPVQHAVFALRSPALTAALRVCTAIGTLPVVVGTGLTGVLILVLCTRSWVPPVVLAAGVALSALTTALVKVAVGRPRPAPDDRIGPPALDFAFPSGHTGNGSAALCLVTALVCVTLPRSTGRTLALAGAIALSAGIGLTRVYLGYHWPTDVVGGWLLAAASTCAAIHVALAHPGRGSRAGARPGALTGPEQGR